MILDAPILQVDIHYESELSDKVAAVDVTFLFDYSRSAKVTYDQPADIEAVMARVNHQNQKASENR